MLEQPWTSEEEQTWESALPSEQLSLLEQLWTSEEEQAWASAILHTQPESAPALPRRPAGDSKSELRLISSTSPYFP